MIILNLALLFHYLIYLNIIMSFKIHTIQIQFRLFELFLYDFIIVLRLWLLQSYDLYRSMLLFPIIHLLPELMIMAQFEAFELIYQLEMVFIWVV